MRFFPIAKTIARSALWIAALAAGVVSTLVEAADVVRVAVSLDPPQDKNVVIIAPTLEALRTHFGPDRLRVTRYALPDLEQALEKGDVDIFISTSGLCRRMAQNGARDLVTMVSDRLPDPNRAYGSVFVVKSSSSIRTFDDMQGRTLTANLPRGFYGYQIAMGEVLARGHSPETFFGRKRFVGRDLRLVVDDIVNGVSDVGTLSSCFLEDTYGPDALGRLGLRIVGQKAPKDSACMTSTELYPNWSVSTMPTTSAAVSKEVAQVLLAMPALEGGVAWSVATDFSKTDALFKSLQLGPFEYLRAWFVTEFLRSYGQWLLLGLGAGALLLAHSLLMQLLVKRRTRALTAALNRELELKREMQSANDKLQAMTRVVLVGQLGTLIAHEIRQPLSAILAYAHGLQRFLETGTLTDGHIREVTGKIQSQAEKAEAIIDRVRAYAKNKEVKHELFDLSSCVTDTCRKFERTPRCEGCRLKLSVESGVRVTGSSIEIALALTNLLRNAADALKSDANKNPTIRVSLGVTGNTAILTVADNGKKTPDSEKMNVPLSTDKIDGLGLGLSIVRSVAKSHGGTLRLEPQPDGGLLAALELPLSRPLPLQSNDAEGVLSTPSGENGKGER